MRVPRKTFDRLVERAIESLPEEFARWLEEVPIIVEDRPGRADQDAESDETVGMFSGPSLAEGGDAGGGAGMALPPRIMLYRVPLTEACRTIEQLAEEIRRTLVHELGHYAGMDEDELDRHGYGDMETDDDDDVAFDVD